MPCNAPLLLHILRLLWFIIKYFLYSIPKNIIAMMLPSTLHLCLLDEDDESLGYLRGIRILLLTVCNTFLFAENNGISSVASSLHCIALGGPLWIKNVEKWGEAKRHPLKYFSDPSHCSPINPWNIKTKLSGISPISMIYDFPFELSLGSWIF